MVEGKNQNKMNYKSVAAGAVVGGIVYYFLGWAVWGMALKGFNDSHASEAALAAMREMPDMVSIVIGCLATTGLFAVIFDKWANISTFMGGMKAGALIGVFLGLIENFFRIAGSTSGDMTSAIVNTIATAVVAAIIAGVVGWTMGKVN